MWSYYQAKSERSPCDPGCQEHFHCFACLALRFQSLNNQGSVSVEIVRTCQIPTLRSALSVSGITRYMSGETLFNIIRV